MVLVSRKGPTLISPLSHVTCLKCHAPDAITGHVQGTPGGRVRQLLGSW